jgi:hypothetical protein
MKPENLMIGPYIKIEIHHAKGLQDNVLERCTGKSVLIHIANSIVIRNPAGVSSNTKESKIINGGPQRNQTPWQRKICLKESRMTLGPVHYSSS